MSACPIHGYRGVVFACRHLSHPRQTAGSRRSAFPVAESLSGAGEVHHWCEDCARQHGLTGADWTHKGWRESYRVLSKQLLPVCAACFEWLAA